MALTQNLNNIFFSEDDIHEKPYDELLTDVQTFITDNHAREVTANGSNAEQTMKTLIGRYLDTSKVRVRGYTTDQLIARLYEDMAGFSFLRKWIYKEGVEEIKVRYRTLFRYDVVDNTFDAEGNAAIIGRHVQVSDISDELRKRMLENGISARELHKFSMKEESYDMA